MSPGLVRLAASDADGVHGLALVHSWLVVVDQSLACGGLEIVVGEKYVRVLGPAARRSVPWGSRVLSGAEHGLPGHDERRPAEEVVVVVQVEVVSELYEDVAGDG